MMNFKLLISFSGRLQVVDIEAPNTDAAMTRIRNINPSESACLVRVL